MATARPPPFITAPAPALPPSRGQSSGIPPPDPQQEGEERPGLDLAQPAEPGEVPSSAGRARGADDPAPPLEPPPSHSPSPSPAPGTPRRGEARRRAGGGEGEGWGGGRWRGRGRGRTSIPIPPTSFLSLARDKKSRRPSFRQLFLSSSC
jgi:hypothetical protein